MLNKLRKCTNISITTKSSKFGFAYAYPKLSGKITLNQLTPTVSTNVWVCVTLYNTTYTNKTIRWLPKLFDIPVTNPTSTAISASYKQCLLNVPSFVNRLLSMLWPSSSKLSARPTREDVYFLLQVLPRLFTLFNLQQQIPLPLPTSQVNYY